MSIPGTTIRSVPIRESLGTTAAALAPWLGLMFAVGLLLARIPYRGVRHDAMLYAAQALAHIDPAWARADLFFAGGFQDHYSVFSNVFALALGHATLGVASIAFLFAAWSLFLWALLRLSQDMPDRDRWLGVFSVLCFSHFYGAQRIFGYLEPFLTARTWAEPLALLSVVALVRGRRILAVGLLALSAAVHPLIALPVALIIFICLVRENRRWAWLLLAALPVLGLAAAGVAPFAGLLSIYDPGWLNATRLANSAVFMSEWRLVDFVAALVFLGVLWGANAGLDTALARVCRAAAIAAVVLCALGFVGADLFHDVLVTQLQLWRSLWIANLLAVFTLPAWMGRLWGQGPTGRLAAAAVFVAAITADSWIATSWALAAWAVLALLLHHRRVALKPSVTLLATVATLLAGLMLCGVQTVNAQGQMAMHQQGMAIARPESIPFTLPLLTLPLGLALLVLWARGRAWRAGAVALAAGLLAIGAMQWDQRTAWTKAIETAERGAHPFDAVIPAGAQVYWHDDLQATWFMLGRPQFIGIGQLAGILFSRQAAEVGSRRMPLLFAVKAGDEDCSSMEWLGVASRLLPSCQLPREPFLDMCSGKPEHADFLVAATDFGTGVVAHWTFAPPGAPPVTYALYDCARVRAELGASTVAAGHN